MTIPDRTFVVRCPFNDTCTTVHAGMEKFSPDAIDEEIAKGTDFGKKLKISMEEVANL